jgi:hypothetical protein
MNPSSVDLRIDELRLTGFPPGDRERIGAALAGELTRLLAEHGLPPGLARGGSIAAVDGGAFRLAPGARPEWIGIQIAGAVYRQLSDPGQTPPRRGIAGQASGKD